MKLWEKDVYGYLRLSQKLFENSENNEQPNSFENRKVFLCTSCMIGRTSVFHILKITIDRSLGTSTKACLVDK